MFGNFSNLRQFIELGGQKGVQRPVLPPGTLMPVHPVAFLVLTPQAVYGLPVAPDLVSAAKASGGVLNPGSLGLAPEQLRVVVIAPQGPLDMVGIVTVLEGEPLASGDIASRLGGYEDIAAMEAVHRYGRRPRPTPRSSRSCSARRTCCTTTTRTSRRSSSTAARSACSTTRCSTARTC